MLNFSTNMKKQYIFLILIVIMLYSIYIIWSYKYKEYKVNINILSLINSIKEIKYGIIESIDLIEYKKTPAYINKILKSQQWLKNKWEIVIYLTPEKKYNKFTNIETIKKTILYKENNNHTSDNTTKYMTIFSKWLYFIFNK